MFAPEHIALYEELRAQAEEKTAAMNPQLLHTLLAGGAGLAAGAIPTALVLNHMHDKEQKQTRNRAFGAGVAAGAATPHILRTLIDRAYSMGLVAPGGGF